MEAMDHMAATHHIQGTHHTMAHMARIRAAIPVPPLLEAAKLTKGARIEAAARRHCMRLFGQLLRRCGVAATSKRRRLAHFLRLPTFLLTPPGAEVRAQQHRTFEKKGCVDLSLG